MKYDYQVSPHKKKKFIKGIAFIGLCLIILAGLVGGVIILDTYLQNRSNTADKTTSGSTTAFFDTKDQVYRSKYFQFQTRNTWTEIPAESSTSKYVYRNLRGSLIEEELVVYVNDIPSTLPATRVLPVSVENNSLSIRKVSEHCIESLKGVSSSRDAEVSFKGVTILCNSDSTQYEVLVGLIGGTTKLTLSRPDDSQASYSIFYRNVKATPDAGQLYQIISSFQTR